MGINRLRERSPGPVSDPGPGHPTPALDIRLRTVVFGPQPGGEVEIKTFGLLPEVTRVWLHTQTSDHPHALSNYHGRGFRTFKTEPA